MASLRAAKPEPGGHQGRDGGVSDVCVTLSTIEREEEGTVKGGRAAQRTGGNAKKAWQRGGGGRDGETMEVVGRGVSRVLLLESTCTFYRGRVPHPDALCT